LNPKLKAVLAAAAMELTHTIQRSNKEKVDEVKRVRNRLAFGESPFSDQEKAAILLCAQTLGINGETKLGEVLSSIREEEEMILC
jgi:predicted porin